MDSVPVGSDEPVVGEPLGEPPGLDPVRVPGSDEPEGAGVSVRVPVGSDEPEGAGVSVRVPVGSDEPEGAGVSVRVPVGIITTPRVVTSINPAFVLRVPPSSYAHHAAAAYRYTPGPGAGSTPLNNRTQHRNTWGDDALPTALFRCAVPLMILSWVLSLSVIGGQDTGAPYWSAVKFYDLNGNGQCDTRAAYWTYYFEASLSRIVWYKSTTVAGSISTSYYVFTAGLYAVSLPCFAVFLVSTLFASATLLRLCILLVQRRTRIRMTAGDGDCPPRCCLGDPHFLTFMRLSALGFSIIFIAGWSVLARYTSAAEAFFTDRNTLNALHVRATGLLPSQNCASWSLGDGYRVALAATFMNCIVAVFLLYCVYLTRSLPGGRTLGGCANHDLMEARRLHLSPLTDVSERRSFPVAGVQVPPESMAVPVQSFAYPQAHLLGPRNDQAVPFYPAPSRFTPHAVVTVRSAPWAPVRHGARPIQPPTTQTHTPGEARDSETTDRHPRPFRSDLEFACGCFLWILWGVLRAFCFIILRI